MGRKLFRENIFYFGMFFFCARLPCDLQHLGAGTLDFAINMQHLGAATFHFAAFGSWNLPILHDTCICLQQFGAGLSFGRLFASCCWLLAVVCYMVVGSCLFVIFVEAVVVVVAVVFFSCSYSCCCNSSFCCCCYCCYSCCW